MRSLRATGLAVAFLAISAIPAGAEGFIVPYLGFNYGGNSNCASLTNCEEKRTNFGVSIGSMGNVVGFEQDFGFAKDFFGKVPGADNSVFTLMSNVLVGAGGGRIQPVRAVRYGTDPTAHVVERRQLRSRRFRRTRSGTTTASASAGTSPTRSGFAATSAVSRPGETCRSWVVPLTIKLDFWRASLGLALRF